MLFEVMYLSEAGRTVTMSVEAETKEDAISVALEEDMGNYSSDCILKIIDVC